MSINITKGQWVVDKSGDIVVPCNGPFNKGVLFSNKETEGLCCPNDDDLRAVLNAPTLVRFVEDVAALNGEGTIIGYEARRILKKIEETEGLCCPNDDDLRAVLNAPTLVRFVEDVAALNGEGTIIGYEARRILKKIEETEV